MMEREMGDHRIATPRLRARAIELGKVVPPIAYAEMIATLRDELAEAAGLSWKYLALIPSQARAAGHDVPSRNGRGGGRTLRTLDGGVHLRASHETLAYYYERLGLHPQAGMSRVLAIIARDDLLAAVLDGEKVFVATTVVVLTGASITLSHPDGTRLTKRAIAARLAEILTEDRPDDYEVGMAVERARVPARVVEVMRR